MGLSIEYQGTREGKDKGNVGGTDKLKIRVSANVSAGQESFIFIRKAWLMSNHKRTIKKA